MIYQPKTGTRCACKPGMQRDNCPACEGTGWVIDFAAIRAQSTYRPLVCGTRRTARKGPSDYRVVCASCDGGGTVKHATHDSAARAAIRDSSKPCPCKPSCGAA